MTEYMVIAPKNWGSFQHYKDRSPKWIKLHRSILDDYDFHCLPTASKALAPLLWLLASEADDGNIACNWDKLAFRLRVSPSECEESVKHLINSGFFVMVQHASAALAERKQDACLEKSRVEIELEKERETDSASAPADKSAKVSVTANDLVKTYGIDKDMAAQWLAVRKDKRMKLTPLAMDKTIAECKKAGITLSAAVKLCCENSWAGFKAEYLANLPQSESPQAADPLVAERKELKYERQQLYADIRQLEALSLPIPADKRRRLSAVEERLREIGN